MMRCKHIRDIIADVREDSENLDHDAEFGISDSTFLRHINHAIKRIHTLTALKAPEIYHKVITVQLGPGNKTVQLPRDIFNNAKVANVSFVQQGGAFSRTVLNRSWKKLDDYGNREFLGTPIGYYIEGDKVIVYPASSLAGTVELTYIVRSPEVNFAVGQLTDTLELDPAWKDAITRLRGCCIVDADGTIIASLKIGVEIDEDLNYLNPTIKDSLRVGLDVVPGVYASTHPDLDNYFERYLEEFCYTKIAIREANAQYQQINMWRELVEQEIEMAYVKVTADYVEIPDFDEISNRDYDYD